MTFLIGLLKVTNYDFWVQNKIDYFIAYFFQEKE